MRRLLLKVQSRSRGPPPAAARLLDQVTPKREQTATRRRSRSVVVYSSTLQRLVQVRSDSDWRLISDILRPSIPIVAGAVRVFRSRPVDYVQSIVRKHAARGVR